ncbi:hypothetical protein [Simiduia agarivorans]|uniref:Uncharacterized protein n=1 Tax=Simiduia agarivorans (strain DSM 21679 / JCM 13881 / BCRC 17597 / SA1) TaxID=1117647 RepID=K4L1S5_SIMAS|nr:hypothetical protein [Simiduia agarivorans]AFV00123.1 hypothetical protein M5M_14940 [Simiduia agarivorans SA1 = DSM 21679]
MSTSSHQLLAEDAQGLLHRARKVVKLGHAMPMSTAASPGAWVVQRLDHHIGQGLKRVAQALELFIRRANSDLFSPDQLMREYSTLKVKYNLVLSELDIFADALNQRSEATYGAWLGGLDVAAKDALQLANATLALPAMICYLDRGHGAAIRRVRTRLPSGEENPVSIIRIPRERMVGAGIAASLYHEVGHQGAALLNLVQLFGEQLSRGQHPTKDHWTRWRSEIIADVWALAKLGCAATTGLISVMSLPKPFVLKMTGLDDPHPWPWLRVMLSCRLGYALFGSDHFKRLEQHWLRVYPLDDATAISRKNAEQLLAAMPWFIEQLQTLQVNGQPWLSLFDTGQVNPVRLRAPLQQFLRYPRIIRHWRPTRVFALLGLARLENAVSAEREAMLLDQALNYWASSPKHTDQFAGFSNHPLTYLAGAKSPAGIFLPSMHPSPTGGER